MLRLNFIFLLGTLCGLFLLTEIASIHADETLLLHTRSRVKTSKWKPRPNAHTKLTAPTSKRPFTLVYETKKWDPKQTAIIICDMWDTMKCKIPADRVAEMAPQMNEVITEARRRGVLIVHSPSGTLNYYRDTPQRELCQKAPEIKTAVPLKWNYLDKKREAKLPIDDSDNGWEGPVGEKPTQTHQHDALKIKMGDAIGASKDVYYLFKQRKIKNVILMGVHTNMCVLGRPFGIRQLTYLGMNVVLMRDMTDSLYNPEKAPYVSHYRGTELVIEHIEKYWCPTILSSDFLNQPAFRFEGDKRKHVVFLVSDDHYHADKTVPEYAQWLREEHQFHCTVLHGAGEHDIPGMSNLKSADVVVVYVRRLGLPSQQIKALQKYVSAGKPLLGLRTANHAFTMHMRPPKNFKVPQGRAEWKDFDAKFLGGNYSNHGPNRVGTEVTIVSESATHPVLKDVTPKTWHSVGSLYYVAPVADDAVVLMQGNIPDRKEPLTWIRPQQKNRGKVFYTGLGHPDDFKQHAFRKLIANAIHWSLKK